MLVRGEQLALRGGLALARERHVFEADAAPHGIARASVGVDDVIAMRPCDKRGVVHAGAGHGEAVPEGRHGARDVEEVHSCVATRHRVAARARRETTALAPEATTCFARSIAAPMDRKEMFP